MGTIVITAIRNTHVNAPFPMLRGDLLDEFVKHGINPEVGVSAAALDKYEFGEFKRVAERILERGLSVTLHGPFIDLSPGSSDPAIRDCTRRRFEQLTKLIPVFKPKTIVCHAGYDWKRYSYAREEWIENSLDTWSWLGKTVVNEGARLMLENVYEDGPEDIRVLFENLSDCGVGFCLDVGHQKVFSAASLDVWLETLGQYLGQVHLHDNRGQRNEHLAIGSGTVDFPVLFDYLKNGKKKELPVITLEPHEKDGLWPSLEYIEKELF